ncbi:MAG TPA: hypothetical protein PLU80_19525, partial [Acidobacteriota bacterium]|nr:hypothetical protein [Acidobacteriota bacterium]
KHRITGIKTNHKNLMVLAGCFFDLRRLHDQNCSHFVKNEISYAVLCVGVVTGLNQRNQGWRLKIALSWTGEKENLR